jgi:mono/diheme cytochrome c family protein
VAVGDAADFDLSMARRRDKFALRFEGTIQLPQEGDYLFLIGSDDGARLLIDDKLIVASDGVHPFEQRRKKIKMTAGSHAVVVEYFQQAGESALQLDFEAPGQTQQPLATLLTAPSIQKGTAPQAEAFAIDPAKAAKGREHFVTLGCAACHTLNRGGSPIAPVELARSLSELGESGGCLDSRPGKTPWYALRERQAGALRAAILAAKHAVHPLTDDQTVERALVRLNCIACHERKHVGGVVEARNVFFQSDMPEMGDEGRLPPSLSGVGAKLTAEWLKTVLEEGAKDRPYMFTRMPKFGAANVHGLAAALEAADAAERRPAPHIKIASEELKRYKAAGRRLVGAQGFSCIKCHTFAGQRSSGIQALSLTTMTRRLRPEWFYHYLQNPLVYRPGTRMPTAFPDGQTTLPAVLDGTVNGQIAAIWTYLADGDKAQFPVGLVTGKIELIAFDEAVIYRNFIEGAGTRAIGVGYPEKLNLAFDASDMRLALLWQGGFIDAARHWTARGQGFEKPLGDKVLKLPDGPAIAVLSDSHAPWPGRTAKELGLRFGGYRLDDKQRPTFVYSWHDASHPDSRQAVQIEDKPQPVGEQDLFAMHRTITATGEAPPGGLWLRAVRAGQIEEIGKGAYKVAYRIDGQWTLTVSARTKPLLRQQDSEWEILIPLALDGPHSKHAKIELTYDW